MLVHSDRVYYCTICRNVIQNSLMHYQRDRIWHMLSDTMLSVPVEVKRQSSRSRMRGRNKSRSSRRGHHSSHSLTNVLSASDSSALEGIGPCLQEAMPCLYLMSVMITFICTDETDDEFTRLRLSVEEYDAFCSLSFRRPLQVSHHAICCQAVRLSCAV